jgi:hypothetical protein
MSFLFRTSSCTETELKSVCGLWMKRAGFTRVTWTVAKTEELIARKKNTMLFFINQNGLFA